MHRPESTTLVEPARPKPAMPMGHADPALPQLATLWNAEAMLEVLRRSLVRIDGCPLELHACAIRRVRYRPGARSIVLYELDAGRPIDATAVTYCDDRATQQHARLLRDVDGASADGITPYTLLRELRTLVQVFPYDRQLPSLPALVAGSHPEATEMLTGARADGIADEWEIATARYRPMQGCTLRYRRADGAGGDFYVKAYRDEAEGRRAHETLTALHDAVRVAGAGFDVARPVGYCHGPRALIVESAPGTPMPALLSSAADPAELGRRAAHALRGFHTGSFTCDSRWGRDEITERTAQAAALISIACPELTESVQRVVGGLAAYPTDFEACPAQLDPKPDHFFFDGERVTFIDLDTFAAADPMFDIAFMYERTRTLADTHDSIARDAAVACAEAFLEESLSLVPACDADRLPINRAYVLLQLALYAVRHQDDEWRALAATRTNAALAQCEHPRRT